MLGFARVEMGVLVGVYWGMLRRLQDEALRSCPAKAEDGEVCGVVLWPDCAGSGLIGVRFGSGSEGSLRMWLVMCCKEYRCGYKTGWAQKGQVRPSADLERSVEF